MNQKLLQEYFSYDSDSGMFTRLKKTANCNKLGPVPIRATYKYGKIRIFGKTHSIHSLAWLYMTGDWPKEQIDHINRDRHDNRWANLRDIPARENLWNSKGRSSENRTGLLGACRNVRGGFTSEIKIDGKRVRLGTFKTAEEAHQAYMAAYFGIKPFSE